MCNYPPLPPALLFPHSSRGKSCVEMTAIKVKMGVLFQRPSEDSLECHCFPVWVFVCVCVYFHALVCMGVRAGVYFRCWEELMTANIDIESFRLKQQKCMKYISCLCCSWLCAVIKFQCQNISGGCKDFCFARIMSLWQGGKILWRGYETELYHYVSL